MKSWAHTYTAGSLLGTALIVAALIAFVPLVSLNAPDEWPTPGLGLDVGGGKGPVGVGTAVVAAVKPEVAEPNSNPLGGAGAPNVAIAVSGQGLHAGGSGGAKVDAPAKETVAVSPASIEVVARNPGSPTSEGAAGPLPSPPETGSAPVSTATEGEVGDVGSLGESPSPTPIDAGVGVEGPAPQPPERPESVPPPPSGSSSEGGDVSDCPEKGDEGEAALTGYGSSAAGSNLDPEPGAGEVEVVSDDAAESQLP